jgi:hypothetical protein
LDDLWAIDASMPFKNEILIEMIRGCVVDSLVRKESFFYFNAGSAPKHIQTIGMKILSLVHF